MTDQPLERQRIAHGSKAGDHTHGTVREMGTMAERFTGMGVAEVQFHVGNRNPKQSIS